MADRFGASSLTALLAVAGMVGVGVAGYRAFNASPDAASLTPVAATCPLMGEDCSMGKAEKASSCCASEAVECDEAAACEGEAKSECKGLTDGCTGDGTEGCCGGCAEKTEGCEEKIEGCSEKSASAEKAPTCCKQAK